MIRKAVENDISAIAQVSSSYSTPLSEKAVQNILNDSAVYVYDDGEVRGFLSIRESVLDFIIVQEQYQRQGIGLKLLNFAKSLFSDISLEVRSDNSNAISFYRSQGFVVSKEFTKRVGETQIQKLSMTWKC